AKAALQRMMFAERRQQRMINITVLAQALEGVHGRAVRLDGQDRACLHCAAVHLNSARAALSGVAPDMHTSHAEALSGEVDEPPSGLDLGLPVFTIHGESDLMTRHFRLLSDRCGLSANAFRFASLAWRRALSYDCGW